MALMIESGVVRVIRKRESTNPRAAAATASVYR
jgi:hypothetical protein